MVKHPLRWVAGAAALATAGVYLPAAGANDIASLKTVFATDVAYAGVGGLRDGGAGSIELTGVTGTVTEAILYWHGPTRTEDPAANAAVNFAGQPITGTNIGLSDENCWPFDNSQAYRADVTALVAGSGTYALDGFTKPDLLTNGAQLVVFYDDGNDANNRDVVMFDGNDSDIDNIFDAPGWNVSLPGINYAGGTASIDLVVSDGQGPGDGPLFLNDEDLDLGPLIFSGDTVPNGGEEQTLWDQRSYDVTSRLVPGVNDLTLTHTQSGDCLSLIVAAVNLPAGAAPDQPPTTTTTTTEAPTTTEPPMTTEPPTTVPEPVEEPVVVATFVAQPVVARPAFTG